MEKNKARDLHEALYKGLTQEKRDKDSDEELVSAFERHLARQEEIITPRKPGTFFDSGRDNGEIEDEWI